MQQLFLEKKHTYNLQVDVLNCSFGLQREALLRSRLLSCSWHQCCGIHAPQVVRGLRSQARNHETWHSYKQRGQALEGWGSLGVRAWINNERQTASHADAFTYPDGGFVVIKSKLKLYTTNIWRFELQGPHHENRILPCNTANVCFYIFLKPFSSLIFPEINFLSWLSFFCI